MNRRKSMPILIFAAVLAAAAAVCGGMALAEGVSDAGEVPAAEIQSASENTVHTGYLISAKDGAVTVSENGENEISELGSDIDAASLRAADRELLEQGIYVENYEELLMLMEDFSS